MLSESQQRELSELAAEVCPELLAQPFYIVDTKQLAGTLWGAVSEVYGFAVGAPGNPNFCPTIAEALAENYIGPGPLVALDTQGISRDCKPGRYNSGLRSVFLHECAHLLPAYPVDEVPRDLPRAREVHQGKVAAAVASPRKVKVDAPKDPHNLRFVRIAAHLFHRAAAGGYEVGCDALLSAASPWRCGQFIDSLADEAERFAKWEFSYIHQLPLPEAFYACWQDYKRETPCH